LNIVFDLGGVVLTWKPEEIIARAFSNPSARALVRRNIFGHHDWSRLDRGTLLYPEAILRATARTGLSASSIAEFFRQVPLSLVAVPETVALLRRLKTKGHRLFYLSNMHTAAMDYVERIYTFWDVFKGGVMSCRVHWVKPEPGIYTCLIEKYELKVHQTVFIDDSPANLEPADRIGMQTIKFDNSAQCERQLMALDWI
jgi:putative hydrolase of the HAD superfamily